MLIRNLISNDFEPMSSHETVQSAILRMEDMGTMNLNVVDDGEFMGYVRLYDLMAMDPSQVLKHAALYHGGVLHEDESLFAAVKLFAEINLDILAVCADNKYMGCVFIKDLVRLMGQSASTLTEGAVVLLKCAAQDYSISQLGRIIESGDGKVLGLWSWQADQGRSLELMVKLNMSHIDNLSLLLSAHGYEVLSKVNAKDGEITDDRYNSLIKYLDI